VPLSDNRERFSKLQYFRNWSSKSVPSENSNEGRRSITHVSTVLVSFVSCAFVCEGVNTKSSSLIGQPQVSSECLSHDVLSIVIIIVEMHIRCFSQCKSIEMDTLFSSRGRPDIPTRRIWGGTDHANNYCTPCNVREKMVWGCAGNGANGNS
jgi:hypothetical protein